MEHKEEIHSVKNIHIDSIGCHGPDADPWYHEN